MYFKHLVMVLLTLSAFTVAVPAPNIASSDAVIERSADANSENSAIDDIVERVL